MLVTKQIARPQFREIAVGVYISETNVNLPDTIGLLRENGLKLITPTKALMFIARTPMLKDALKGKCFRLAGEGLTLWGEYTFDNNGRLSEGNGGTEKTVYAYPGSNQLLLGLHPDYQALIYGKRFYLSALNGPTVPLPVVLGVREGYKAAPPRTKWEGIGDSGRLGGLRRD